jgi:hypothetical protein
MSIRTTRNSVPRSNTRCRRVIAPSRGIAFHYGNMKHLLNSVRLSVATGNYHAALSLALALPDICGKLETPNLSSTARYTSWFTANLEGQYTKQLGPHGMMTRVFLCGDDCYALRCAYLHEGDLDITGQRIQSVLARFHFISPPPNNNVYHMNIINNILVLQVDLFCEEICLAVEAWMGRVSADPDIALRIQALPQIR